MRRYRRRLYATNTPKYGMFKGQMDKGEAFFSALQAPRERHVLLLLRPGCGGEYGTSGGRLLRFFGAKKSMDGCDGLVGGCGCALEGEGR